MSSSIKSTQGDMQLTIEKKRKSDEDVRVDAENTPPNIPLDNILQTKKLRNNTTNLDAKSSKSGIARLTKNTLLSPETKHVPRSGISRLARPVATNKVSAIPESVPVGGGAKGKFMETIGGMQSPRCGDKSRPTPNRQMKPLHSVSSQHPSALEMIKEFLEKALSIPEFDLKSIHVGSKKRGPINSKDVKNYEDSIKVLKDQCQQLIESKTKLCHYLAIFLAENEDNVAALSQNIVALQISEISLKEELVQISRARSSSESKLKSVELELLASKSKEAESSNLIARLHADLVNEKAAKDAAVAKYSEQKSSSIQSVTTLQEQISKHLSDLSVLEEHKIQSEQRIAELREETVRLQSCLREDSYSKDRLEKDISRFMVDVDELKRQLATKNDDFRNTLQSLNEVQRQYSEEKSCMRSETTSLQSRIQSLEQDRLSTTTELYAKREECISINRELVAARELCLSLETRLAARESEIQLTKDVATQLEVEKSLRHRSEQREEEEKRERIAASGQLLAIQMESHQKQLEYEAKLSSDGEARRQEVESLRSQYASVQDELRRQADVVMAAEIEAQQLRKALDRASSTMNTESVEKLGKVTAELEILRRRLREVEEVKSNEGVSSAQRVKELEDQLKVGELQRRKLHNTIQELRGNVRVFARVRPFLETDGIADSADTSIPTIQTRPDETSLRIAKAAAGDHRAEEYVFSFDKVFGPTSTQDTVFVEVAEFVQSALDGYNVCLFSYGQTGSGKTHTMQGSGNGAMRGIIPRAIQQVGKYKSDLEANGWVYEMQVSFVEIYNETIRDLLRTSTSAAELKHEIKRDHSGNTQITDVVMESVDPCDEAQLEDIMHRAACHRSVAHTAMNEQSSRSHSVFTLHMRATHREQKVQLRGTLNLVDLAGSERLDRSGATGTTMKETVAINKSLSALTDVFVAIGNKQPHIPFRNSKLTYLLQPALSGDGKTLMMVNMSPTEESYFESLCSLRFAAQVNQCELGKPKRQLRDEAAAPATPAASTHNSHGPASAASSSSSAAGGARANKLQRK